MRWRQRLRRNVKMWMLDCVCTRRLLGMEKDLVLYGGGNTSVKSTFTDITGRQVPSIYVKASGCHLADMTADDLVLLDFAWLSGLRSLKEMSDESLREVLQTHLLRLSKSVPSVEAMMHVFIPGKFVDHTHPSAILALVNRENGVTAVKEALGEDVPTVPYIKAGFGLAKAVSQTIEKYLVHIPGSPSPWTDHLGETAQESYEKTINLVSRAEEYQFKISRPVQHVPVSLNQFRITKNCTAYQGCFVQSYRKRGLSPEKNRTLSFAG